MYGDLENRPESAIIVLSALTVLLRFLQSHAFDDDAQTVRVGPGSAPSHRERRTATVRPKVCGERDLRRASAATSIGSTRAMKGVVRVILGPWPDLIEQALSGDDSSKAKDVA